MKEDKRDCDFQSDEKGAQGDAQSRMIANDEARQRRRLDHEMHVNINKRQERIGARGRDASVKFEHWLYESKRLMSELRCLPVLYAKERKGELPTEMRYCSMSQVEAVPDNKLLCCLGQEVKACEILRDVFDGLDFPPEMIDNAKAHVCVTHILTESTKRMVDTSEGYVTDASERQFWQTTYHYMAMDEPSEPCDHKRPDGTDAWKGQRQGGDPADAGSNEWVVYCDLCGVEKDDD